MARSCISQRKYEHIPQPQRFEESGLVIYLGKTPLGTPLRSEIDFTPTSIETDDSISLPRRSEGSRIMLTGLHAMQDYVLLADAGVIEAPSKIYGTTNETMATIATRIGFQERGTTIDGVAVVATVSDIRDRVFSPEARHIEETLERRLASLQQRMGQAAVSAD